MYFKLLQRNCFEPYDWFPGSLKTVKLPKTEKVTSRLPWFQLPTLHIMIKFV